MHVWQPAHTRPSLTCACTMSTHRNAVLQYANADALWRGTDRAVRRATVAQSCDRIEFVDEIV